MRLLDPSQASDIVVRAVEVPYGLTEKETEDAIRASSIARQKALEDREDCQRPKVLSPVPMGRTELTLNLMNRGNSDEFSLSADSPQ
jgi:hypothetical protein